MARQIHVVFKTHLDVGFTNFAREVVRQYMTSYIPRAVALARERREAGADRFVWTTGSWLISEYLEQADNTARRAMEAAILSGDIRWHALPFTTHTELLDAELFRAGVGLSRALDIRFGMTTITAKMTDVPGHTRAIVPLLAEAGVRFVHIGVNPACHPPAVPDLFRWRDLPTGTEVLMMYHGNYGEVSTVAGLDHALAFAHTGDNNGPQSTAVLSEQFAHLRAQFPQDLVIGSTMEPFAQALLGIADELPVVEGEIGDTWIHGGGTDPCKVAGFRALSRLRRAWLAAGRVALDDPMLQAFTRSLLLIAEHTWGLDEKNTLADFINYTREDFARVRREDPLVIPVPPEFELFVRYREQGRPRGYQQFAASWAEQRAYLASAVTALGDSELAKEAVRTLQALTPVAPTLADGASVDLTQPFKTARFTVQCDPLTGAITRLRVRDSGYEWADTGHPLALLRYQTFSSADYERYIQQYAVHVAEHSSWIIPDLGKPGLRPDDSPSAFFLPTVTAATCAQEEDSVRLLLTLTLPMESHQHYGAPRIFWLDYRFPHDASAIEITLTWADKPANRMPEALWCTFAPCVAQPERWMLEKMGALISPLEVVEYGNRNMHAVDEGAVYTGKEGTLRLQTMDAPLIAPGAPRLLHFDNTPPDLSEGLHVNLYNNIWGTNFPMWYEEDACFRFRVSIE